MANRHKAQAKVIAKNVGGATPIYGNPKVLASAKSGSNKSGAIQKAEGGAVEKRAEGGKVEGKASGGRLDKRARGGKVGAFASGGSPFSAASKVKG